MNDNSTISVFDSEFILLEFHKLSGSLSPSKFAILTILISHDL